MTAATKPAKNTVTRKTVAKAAAKAAPKRLSLVTRARRGRGLPFRERLEVAMHRELKHDGPVCHRCRINASQLAALSAMPKVVAV